MTDRLPSTTVKEVAEQLNVRPQLIYKLIREGDLEAWKPADSRSKCVRIKDAREALEKEKDKSKSKGGRHLNWKALTAHLQKAKAKEVRLDVTKLREMVEAPKAKLEMLHYWDPYRANFNGQGPGLKAIRAAGFEIKSIRFEYSEFISMMGAAIITVKREN